jgi:F-type H+-transporting ATPase subunit delta
MAVGTGRARELPAIIDSLVAMSAAQANRAVAEVRSAIDLTDDQRTRLASAIESATGKQVEVKVIVDPSILGGIVTTVGDTVLDGSVRTRLERLKQQF